MSDEMKRLIALLRATSGQAGRFLLEISAKACGDAANLLESLERRKYYAAPGWWEGTWDDLEESPEVEDMEYGEVHHCEEHAQLRRIWITRVWTGEEGGEMRTFDTREDAAEAARRASSTRLTIASAWRCGCCEKLPVTSGRRIGLGDARKWRAEQAATALAEIEKMGQGCAKMESDGSE